MNRCSTGNTSWGTPELKPVIRKGRRIGLLGKDAHGKWHCLSLIDTPKNRQLIELRLALMNQP